MADSSSDNAPPGPARDIILEETLLEHLVEIQNYLLFALCQQAPEIENIIEQDGGIALVDSPIGIGGTSEYWQTFRQASLWDIHQERKRIYRVQDNVEDDFDALKSLIRTLNAQTAALDPVPPVIDHYGVGKFWQKHVRMWSFARKGPVQNRLLILHWCESLRRSGKSSPEKDLLAFARSRNDSGSGRGRPSSSKKWRRRKENVVQLLIESDNEYESPHQFYWDLAVEDDDWKINPTTVRDYFERRLDHSPEDMEEWRLLSSYWAIELQVDREHDWDPLEPGWEPGTS